MFFFFLSFFFFFLELSCERFLMPVRFRFVIHATYFHADLKKMIELLEDACLIISSIFSWETCGTIRCSIIKPGSTGQLKTL